MTRGIGQTLRAVGLLIELVGVIAVMAQSRTDPVARVPLPGGTSVPLGWLAVGGGFFIWLIGRIVIAAAPRPRPGQRRQQPPDRNGISSDAPK